VSVSERKMVFVVSGPCELLIGKMPVASGNAQVVSAVADHTAVIVYRTAIAYPTEEAWRADCERVKALTGKGIVIQTAGENLTWEAGDLTAVAAEGPFVMLKQQGQ
jgi:hypothetical protein